jgi:hypothetical protein
METTELTISADLLASKHKRFLNVLIDLFIVYLFTGIGALINGMSCNRELSSSRLDCQFVTHRKRLVGTDSDVFYYFIMEFYLSRTFGSTLLKH